jgi:hypothetical protein
MRLHRTLIASYLIISSSCAAARDNAPNARPGREATPAEVADPMMCFARLVGGE